MSVPEAGSPVDRQESVPVGGVLGSPRFPGEGVSLTSGCLLPSPLDSFFFFLVVLVTRGLLGNSFGGHIEKCG